MTCLCTQMNLGVTYICQQSPLSTCFFCLTPAAEQQKVLALLLSNVEGEEECRNVVAECLGKLALLHPQSVLSALSQRVASPSANMRSVVRVCGCEEESKSVHSTDNLHVVTTDHQ